MGKAYIVKTRQDWMDQANEGVKVGEKYQHLEECKELRGLLKYTKQNNYEDWKKLGKMIEAFIALGVSVTDEIKKLADIKSVNEVLGLPEDEEEEEYDEPYNNEPDWNDESEYREQYKEDE